MRRRSFIQNTALLAAGYSLGQSFRLPPDFPVVRPAPSLRRFTSPAIELAIKKFSTISNKELAWLFGNCFPNTLDTTVAFGYVDNKPDTYVITGDIDAMWLRDSTAQMWPYLSFMKEDPKLKSLIAGVINRQVRCINLDPYANAFYKDESQVSEWKDDLTTMKPGIHERKWEIDSLCYPIRLAYNYWKITGDHGPFDQQWHQSIHLTLQTFREQQRINNDGPYSFQRRTSWATDGIAMAGYGYPVKPVGLICSMFRPSDDATVFSFLVPSNFFAVTSLRQAGEMIRDISQDKDLSMKLFGLAKEVEKGLQKYAIVNHENFGRVYAYEVNGMGSFNLMDDANIPSLLAMPYLGSVKINDPVYQRTRRMILSDSNPFYFIGKAAEGIGGPHVGKDMIWPLGIIARALTSASDAEITTCLQWLQRSHSGTGFMHESFHKDDYKKYTRKWFAWANTIYGELLWKTFNSKPWLLKG